MRCLPQADDVRTISEKLEVINLQFARGKAAKRNALHWMLIALCASIVIIFSALIVLNSPYLGWDYHDPETAVFGAAFHTFEYLFVRLAPIIFTGALVGTFLIRK